jgi:uncharacterized protein
MLKVVKLPRKGRGVIALKQFKEGDLIEECHVLLFDMPYGNRHLLEEYAFRWSDKQIALALGNGSLYNHSFEPNAVFVPDKRSRLLRLFAFTDIPKGSEITFDYCGSSSRQLWFKTV